MYKTTDVHIGLCVLARQKVLCNVKSSQLNTDTKSLSHVCCMQNLTASQQYISKSHHSQVHVTVNCNNNTGKHSPHFTCSH